MVQTVTNWVTYRRGCGVRRPGLYATTDPAGVTIKIQDKELNVPFTALQQCPPPIVEDPSAIGLTPRGVLIKEATWLGRPECWDMLAIIGKEGYPYPADWIMEARNLGVSWRIPTTAPISLLDENSYQIMIHPRGWIDNYDELYKNRIRLEDCPLGHNHHDDDTEPKYSFCAGLYYECVGEGDGNGYRRYQRSFPPDSDPPTFSYRAATLPDGFVPQYKHAIVAIFPFEWEVVADPLDNTHEQAEKLLKDLGKPYTLVSE